MRQQHINGIAWAVMVALGFAPCAIYAQAKQHFQIGAGQLSSNLNRFAQLSGITIVFSPQLTQNKHSVGLSGQYDVMQGLYTLLQGTSLQVQKNGSVYTVVAASPKMAIENPINSVHSTMSSPDSVDLGTVEVIGSRHNMRDQIGQSKVYNNSMSTVYAGKKQIDLFKGATSADVFKGMVGVQTGDARNSGALDPNIRGIQGQGRVPLTIDGTEQSVTVWRGYNGANNRNYIDPMLVGGITLEKGPSLSRDVNGSVGGAVVVSTLSIDDVVAEGKDFGVDIKLEASNNAVKPRFPSMQQGVLVNQNGQVDFNGNFDHDLMKTAKTAGRNGLGHDQAFRVAVGKKWEDFDVLAAYAYRKKGNHFAGKNGAKFYQSDEDTDQKDTNYWNNYTQHLTEVYRPGAEVPNTSTDMQSFLVKGTWKPNTYHQLQLGLRHSFGEYGEIMPSRVAADKSWLEMVMNNPDANAQLVDYLKQYAVNKVPQWPTSEVKASAVNLSHKWNPDNPYINWQANLWMTQTTLNTHTSGGSPREAFAGTSQIPESLRFTLRNTSLTHSKDKRWGLTASNHFDLTPSLSLLVGGHYQHETLSSKDNWYTDANLPEKNSYNPYRSAPREGWRKEWDLNFNFRWEANDWLSIQAGARKNGYSSFDEQLAKQRRAKNSKYAVKSPTRFDIDYYVPTPDDVQAAYQNFVKAKDGLQNGTTSVTDFRQAFMTYQTSKRNHPNLSFGEIDGNTLHARAGQTTWTSREDGRFYREDNPLMNGEFAQNGYHVKSQKDVRLVESMDSLGNDSLRFADVQKQGNSGSWQPVLSANARISDNGQAYVRYAKTQRMPSMFESTVGFSASPLSFYQLKPEKSTNLEIGYSHDLSQWLAADRYADIKVAWFKNEIKNVIDRTPAFVMVNTEKQTVEGIELQSRYDNGRFFADFSASYFLKNQVCDSSMALQMDPIHGSVNRCVDDGFINSYLRNMTPPKYSLNLTLGTRLLDEKLELGMRLLHHAGSKDNSKKNFGDLPAWPMNVPVHWGKVTTVDAWLNYQWQKDWQIELVATNLTDQYYLDPLTRSHFPAPGRTIRLGIQKKF